MTHIRWFPVLTLVAIATMINFSANLAGIVTPIVIGVAFQRTGSFVGPLIYIGAVALLGAFSYSVILGDIHRLDVDPGPTPAPPPDKPRFGN